tara:strand:- start:48 stop:287 length:240 start_codon:yes stop_codon:yes gene_type:complete
MMIDELETIKACNEALDQIADGDVDSAVMTISTLRADNQKKVDEFDKWADEESKKQESMAVPDEDWQEHGTDKDGQNYN